jgi:hypothetical protein
VGGDVFSVRVISPMLTTCSTCTDCVLDNINVSSAGLCRTEVRSSLCSPCPGVDALLLDLSKQRDCQSQSLFNYSEPCNAGTYLSVSVLTISGQYIASVRFSAASLRKSPFLISVAPSAPYPLLSTLSINQQYTASAGSTHPFLISSSDRYGNILNTAATGNSFRLEAMMTESGRSVGSALSNSLPDQSGAFTANFLFTISGTYSIAILVLPFEEPIRGSPFRITVLAGWLNASNSNIVGAGITIATAGVLQSFRVIARDQYMNLKTGRVLNFSQTLPATLSSKERNLSIAFDLKDTEDGTLTGAYVATVAGVYALILSYESVYFAGIPSNITVKPGPVSAKHVLVAGQGLSSTLVNTKATFSIVESDIFANPRSIGGNRYYITLLGGWTRLVNDETSDATNSSAVVIDIGDGSYVANYILTKSGVFRIDVYLQSSSGLIPVLGSPFFNLTVIPSDVRGQACVIFGITNSTRAENPKNVLLLAKDSFGNPVDPPPSASTRFNGVISFNSSLQNASLISYVQDGVFAVGFPGKFLPCFSAF